MEGPFVYVLLEFLHQKVEHLGGGGVSIKTALQMTLSFPTSHCYSLSLQVFPEACLCLSLFGTMGRNSFVKGHKVPCHQGVSPTHP